MKSTSLFRRFLRYGACAAVSAGSLASCSTVKDLSPFSSNVPYSQDVKPTMQQPATTEIPAFKAAPPKTPKAQPAPSAESPQTPPASDTPPPAPQSALPPPSNTKIAAAAPADPVAASNAVASDATAAQTAPAPRNTDDTVAPQATQAPPQGRPGHPVTRPADAPPPEIADAERVFQDDGTYPNLARVPARPVNMPTFLQAANEEKQLIADREAAKDKRPDSPPNPSPETLPDPSAQAPANPAASTKPAAVIADRAEDAAPCLSAASVVGQPAATVRFQPGSAALNADDLVILADAVPVVRGAKGTIRVFGHGDVDPASSQVVRFDLAAARAGAVAQALAGYGISPPRIAVGVACADASAAAASVQLYADS
jgi:outer membrane protein OmpA-like peptidoglycan-associated protein